MKLTSKNNTHKTNIINNISNYVGLANNYGLKLVDDLILILINNVIKKKHLKIKNFGTFTLKKKEKRIGRNPKNKINYEILARNVLTFKAAEKLKRKM
jgi:integration host factor subunit alpha